MNRILPIAFLLILSVNASAGNRDSSVFETLNLRRIHTDMTGMKVLGGWGLANTIVGISGAVAAKDDEWKHFHQMNAAWGIVNLSIAGLSYLGARRELGKSYSNLRALHRYESTRRLYLLNAGLDGLYIGTGVYLREHAERGGGNEALFRGFGNSLILQGAGLLIFDVNMILAHGRADKGWYRALQGFCVTGDGISWRYAIR